MSDSAWEVNPRDGSTLYYSLLYTTAEIKARLCARLAMINAVNRTLLDVREPQVIQSKIHWWHEEIDRLIDGQSRHPALQLSASEFTGRQAARQVCLDLLGSAAHDRTHPPSHDTVAEQRLQQGLGAQLALVSHALLQDDQVLLDDAFRFPSLALGLGRVDHLLQLPSLLRHGYPVFSSERYTQFQLNPSDLMAAIGNADDPPDTPVQSFLRQAITDAQDALQAARQQPPFLDFAHRAQLLPLITFAALRTRQVEIWHKQPPNLLRERSTPTPIAKLFTAWRCRRQYR